MWFAMWALQGCESWKHVTGGIGSPIGEGASPRIAVSGGYQPISLPIAGVARVTGSTRGGGVAVGLAFDEITSRDTYSVKLGWMLSVYGLQLGWLDGLPEVAFPSPEVTGKLMIPTERRDDAHNTYLIVGLAAGYDWRPSAQPSELWIGVRIGWALHERW